MSICFNQQRSRGTRPGVWLGHESIETTNLYLHVNLDMKETALAKIQPMDTPFRRFHLGDRLSAFMESLGGCPP
jgi:hypothetical protein